MSLATILLLLLLGLAGLCAAALLRSAVQRGAKLCAALSRAGGPAIGGYAPYASLIVPCCGLDPGFAINIQALLRQDYPRYEVIFVTSDTADPAYAALAQMKAHELTGGHHTLVVAGQASRCSEKVHYELRALQATDPASEVLVFADCDGRVHPGFLRHLVAPLAHRATGATTGYRWFPPVHGRPLEILTALWGMIVVMAQADPQFAQLWGGAMAIRRETFETLAVSQAWTEASTDDDALTRLLQRAGLGIVLVPHSFVRSTAPASLAEFMTWGTRQLLFMRVYLPAMWWLGMAATAGFALFPVAGLVLTLAGLVTRPTLIAAGLELLVAGLAPTLGTALVARGVERLAAAWGQPLKPLAARHFPACLPGIYLFLAQYVLSGCTRRVVWRGVTYELLASDRTVVVETTR